MKSKYYIRTNGRANAWPVFIGSEHPFYSADNPDDLSNASFSIISSGNDNDPVKDIRYEVVVDAGNNTASYIIRNENRIPEAIVLTHPHLDHTVGVDWISQSYWYKSDKKRKYPLYATGPCWNFVRQSYPHLNQIIEFKELKPGIHTKIEETDNLRVTAFPVFHGESAYGSSMLAFDILEDNTACAKALFTGDMLCPLLRNKDYEFLKDAGVIYIDCNNRYSYPKSNHGSLITTNPGDNYESRFLTEWKKEASLLNFIAPQLEKKHDPSEHPYFAEFLADNPDTANILFSIVDLLKRINIPDVKLVHYSGYEDKKYHNQKIVNDKELEAFANDCGSKYNLVSRFSVPKVGELFHIL